MLKKSGKSSDY